MLRKLEAEITQSENEKRGQKGDEEEAGGVVVRFVLPGLAFVDPTVLLSLIVPA